MADLAICVSAGINWLEKAPWEPQPVNPFPVTEAPVVWIDFDNGQDILDERFEALGRQYNQPEDLQLFYYSMLTPQFNFRRDNLVIDILAFIKAHDAKLVIIDNLGIVSGDADENSSEMIHVTNNLRVLAELSGAAVVVIHHSRKETGFKGGKGDNLRGHSSIRGSINMGLYVDRDDATVTVRSEKTRRTGVQPFGAYFSYVHKSGSSDLETARFFGVPVKGNITDQEIQEEIIEILTKILPGGGLSQNKLVLQVRQNIPGASDNRTRILINQLVHAGQVKKQPGPRNGFSYYI
jgi:hypothetical protein